MTASVFEVTVSTHDEVKAGRLEVARRRVTVGGSVVDRELVAVQAACARPVLGVAAMPTGVVWLRDLTPPD